MQAAQRSATISPQLITRSELQQALLNATAVATRCKAELVQAAASLTGAVQATQTTSEFVLTADGLVSMGGRHITPAQMAEKMGLAKAAYIAPLKEALALLRGCSEAIPVHQLEVLSKLEEEKGDE
jgi:hypothetical protein